MIQIDIDENGNGALRPVAMQPGDIIKHLELMKLAVFQSAMGAQAQQQRVLPVDGATLNRLNGKDIR